MLCICEYLRVHPYEYIYKYIYLGLVMDEQQFVEATDIGCVKDRFTLTVLEKLRIIKSSST